MPSQVSRLLLPLRCGSERIERRADHADQAIVFASYHSNPREPKFGSAWSRWRVREEFLQRFRDWSTSIHPALRSRGTNQDALEAKQGLPRPRLIPRAPRGA